MIVILLVVAASSVAVPLATACGLLVCGLGMTKGVISANDLNESDKLDDSFRCCFFFVLFSLLLSTLAVNVRAREEDGEEELSDVSESVSWGLVVGAVVASSVVDTCDVEGRSRNDSEEEEPSSSCAASRFVRLTMGSDNMLSKFWVRVFDMAEQGGLTGAALEMSSVSIAACDVSCDGVGVSVGAAATVGSGSMPGTRAAGTGGGAGRGDMGSLVGNKGCLISGRRL